MYGKKRVSYLTRLIFEVYPGENEATLQDSMDIYAGDVLYFGPTAL